ncbi:hypothetical protein M422DRAFT_32896, partial [Sphaerobolus stellatus SS14]
KSRHTELFWRYHQAFLQNRRYTLRPRYHPQSQWVPSWIGNRNKPARRVLDAIRTSDKVKVIIKRVKTNTEEIPIGCYLSSDLLRKDPRNHCVHILDVIPLPDNDDEALIVMPFLRSFHEPLFEYKSEYVEASNQLLEGLVFMHEHNVSHMDPCLFNITMDSSQLIPRGFHFANENTHDGVTNGKFDFKNRRDVAPVSYYFIDFGLNFLRSLVESMRQTDPSQRPDASEALEHFLKLIGTLSPDDLNTDMSRHIDLYMGEPNKWRRRPVTVPKPRPLKSLLNKLIGHLGKWHCIPSSTCNDN